MRILFIFLILPFVGMAQPSYKSNRVEILKPTGDTIGVIYKRVAQINDTSFIDFGNQEIIIKCSTCPEKEVKLAFAGGEFEEYQYEDGGTLVTIKAVKDGIKGIFGMTFLKDGSPSHCYFSNKNGMTRWEKMTKN